ncbi:Spx/MgsR family RNA polymerase-binding regulatory protein [Cyanobium sp. WAJ14-Wanaka]|nr:Spx/MgsR family RNA polymerase-binding regulatory protein [Cyanobium sp. WAJ14-Wanaka]
MGLPVKLYSYSSCSTCRKAIAWLKERGYSPEPIDITTIPPSPGELALALEQLGRKRLFNTSGLSYRALGSAVVNAMDDDQALAALAADGKLIKRPFLVIDGPRVVTGFKAEEWQELL